MRTLHSYHFCKTWKKYLSFEVDFCKRIPLKKTQKDRTLYKTRQYWFEVDCCSVLQCVAVYCSVLQCVAVAVCGSENYYLQEKVEYGWGINGTQQRWAWHEVTADCSSVLQCVAVCCSVLQCVAVCCSVLQWIAVCCECCIVLQCVVVCSANRCVLLWVAVCCSVLQCAAVDCGVLWVLQCVVVCCSVLQCVAVYLSALTSRAVTAILSSPPLGSFMYNTLQHTATHCNTLQHTATHCNTLQHTTTHCNTLHHLQQHFHV